MEAPQINETLVLTDVEYGLGDGQLVQVVGFAKSQADHPIMVLRLLEPLKLEKGSPELSTDSRLLAGARYADESVLEPQRWPLTVNLGLYLGVSEAIERVSERDWDFFAIARLSRFLNLGS